MRQVVAREGPLTLARTGAVWEILWDGTFLMSSECRISEIELGRLARGRTLVGGLGMGFTLRAALDAGATSVDVVEISRAVIEWNRGPLAELAGRPLADPRVRVHCGDVADFLGGDYDAVLLDVDNGPSWLSRPENARLYEPARLRGKLVAIWSAQREPALAARMHERAIPVVVAGRPQLDYLYSASAT